MVNSTNTTTKKPNKFLNYWKEAGVAIISNPMLYLMLVPGLIYFYLFKIQPFLGLSLAFFEFNPVNPEYFSGDFAGLKYFKLLFTGSNFYLLFKNTLILSIYSIVFFFPLPIILALLLNEVRWTWYRKFVQTITYIPHFFSWVVIAGISYALLTVDGGGINNVLQGVFGTEIKFLTDESWFRPIIVGQQIWKDIGWGTIVYLAAITSIDMEMYEAASMDGASRLRKIWSITLPNIAPTIAILLILRMGTFMDSGFDQIFLMLNPANAPVAQVFDTFIYEQGIVQGKFSYTTAVGIFKSCISLFMVVTTNKIAKKLGNDGIM